MTKPLPTPDPASVDAAEHLARYECWRLKLNPKDVSRKRLAFWISWNYEVKESAAKEVRLIALSGELAAALNDYDAGADASSAINRRFISRGFVDLVGGNDVRLDK